LKGSLESAVVVDDDVDLFTRFRGFLGEFVRVHAPKLQLDAPEALLLSEYLRFGDPEGSMITVVGPDPAPSVRDWIERGNDRARSEQLYLELLTAIGLRG
jgi:hypothetical protein